MNDLSLRIPPHSIQAEQSVLGGILLDNPSYHTIASLLNDDDFYRHDHQLIFRAMKDMAADQQMQYYQSLCGVLKQHSKIIKMQ